MMKIEISDQQSTLAIEPPQLERVARAILADYDIDCCELSIAIVDDPTIHALNRQYLQHDYPTDVLSFVFAEHPPRLEGEVIVSADTALAQAAEFGSDGPTEVLLYVIHGVLHLVGLDDQNPEQREEMRCAERVYLEQLGRKRTP